MQYEEERCKTCGKGFREGQRIWGIVWDGTKYWLMVKWAPTMPIGPYHGGQCISPELNERNKEGNAMPVIRRHPAEVTADRLVEATEKWPDKFDGRDRDMVGELVHILNTIAEEADK